MILKIITTILYSIVVAFTPSTKASKSYHECPTTHEDPSFEIFTLPSHSTILETDPQGCVIYEKHDKYGQYPPIEVTNTPIKPLDLSNIPIYAKESGINLEIEDIFDIGKTRDIKSLNFRKNGQSVTIVDRNSILTDVEVDSSLQIRKPCQFFQIARNSYVQIEENGNIMYWTEQNGKLIQAKIRVGLNEQIFSRKTFRENEVISVSKSVSTNEKG